MQLKNGCCYLCEKLGQRQQGLIIEALEDRIENYPNIMV